MNRRLVPGHQQHAAIAGLEPRRFLNIGFPDTLVDAVLNLDLTSPLAGTGFHSGRGDQ